MKLAARGLRDMDGGSQPITDSAELRQVRGQARMVHIKSVISAAVITAIAMLI